MKLIAWAHEWGIPIEALTTFKMPDDMLNFKDWVIKWGISADALMDLNIILYPVKINSGTKGDKNDA